MVMVMVMDESYYCMTLDYEVKFINLRLIVYVLCLVPSMKMYQLMEDGAI